jgi:hypothetical protein
VTNVLSPAEQERGLVDTGSVTTPIRLPDNRESERLEENSGAVAVALTSDHLSEIENAMSKITVVGDRYQGALRHLSDI